MKHKDNKFSSYRPKGNEYNSYPTKDSTVSIIGLLLLGALIYFCIVFA